MLHDTIAGFRESTEYIDIFFRPSLNRVLFPMFCLLVKGECFKILLVKFGHMTVNIVNECLRVLIDCSQLSKTYYDVLFGSFTWDRHARRRIGGRSENNIKCVVHDDLGWQNRTTRYILPHHWLYEWFSQFHGCGTYSVLSRSPSIVDSKLQQ